MTKQDYEAGRQVGAKIAETLLPYLKAWNDAQELGEPEFDNVCNVEELASFLGRLLVA